MRVADRRRHAVRQDASVELVRRDERGFDMHMRVDEARHDDAPPPVDLAGAAIGAIGTHDGVAAHGDIGLRQGSGDEIEQAPVLDDEIGRTGAARLRDASLESVRADRHGRLAIESPVGCQPVRRSSRQAKRRPEDLRTARRRLGPRMTSGRRGAPVGHLTRGPHEFATVFSGERCGRGRRMCGRSMPTCSR